MWVVSAPHPAKTAVVREPSNHAPSASDNTSHRLASPVSYLETHGATGACAGFLFVLRLFTHETHNYSCIVFSHTYAHTICLAPRRTAHTGPPPSMTPIPAVILGPVAAVSSQGYSRVGLAHRRAVAHEHHIRWTRPGLHGTANPASGAHVRCTRPMHMSGERVRACAACARCASPVRVSGVRVWSVCASGVCTRRASGAHVRTPVHASGARVRCTCPVHVSRASGVRVQCACLVHNMMFGCRACTMDS